jgi:hypothetical protein
MAWESTPAACHTDTPKPDKRVTVQVLDGEHCT